MVSFRRRDVLAGAGVMMMAGRLNAQERAQVEAAARKEGRVALATSVSVADFPKFLTAFSKRYPFIDITSDLYQAATGTVLARVDAELRAGRPNFDVLHIANPAAYLAYARDGMLETYASPELSAYPDSAHDGGKWTTVRAVGVMIAYNKNVLAADKAPVGWADLLKPEFAGKKIAIQNAAAGSWMMGVYMLRQTLGLDYLKRLSAQQLVITSGAAQQLDLLNRGEVLVGAGVDHTVLFTEATQRAGIVPVYPAEGMPAAATPIAILKGAPHPNAARLLIDYMLSREGQQVFVQEVMKNYSLRKDIDTPAGQKPLADARPLTPRDLADYETFVKTYPDTFNTLFKPA